MSNLVWRMTNEDSPHVGCYGIERGVLCARWAAGADME